MSSRFQQILNWNQWAQKTFRKRWDERESVANGTYWQKLAGDPRDLQPLPPVLHCVPLETIPTITEAEIFGNLMRLRHTQYKQSLAEAALVVVALALLIAASIHIYLALFAISVD